MSGRASLAGSARGPLAGVRDSIRLAGLGWTASLAAERLLRLPALGWWRDWTVSRDALSAQLGTVFQAWGMSAEDASVTVQHVLYADLHGIDSHGSGMLLHYHRGRLDGSIVIPATVAMVRESATTALLDGGGGLGHVPADRATRVAIEKCRESGVAAVAVRNSGHFGAAGAYAAMVADAGFVGLATTNTQRPAVVPTFGRDAMLGTNPIAFAAPAGRNPPFLLDMATSTASLGKLHVARRKGRRIPRGWALDGRGQSVRNPRIAAERRRLTPLGASAELGSHKGYGLGAMVEILSAIVPGLRPGRIFGAADADGGVGHFFLTLDPARFREPGAFGADLDRMIDALRETPAIDPRQSVMVAGDPERVAHTTRKESGIPLARAVIEDLRFVARAAGVSFVLEGDP